MESRAPVHISRQIFREEPHDDTKEDGDGDGYRMTGGDLAIAVGILSEDEADAKEETAHHIAIAALYEVDDFQALPRLPAAEQQHDEADEIGGGC